MARPASPATELRRARSIIRDQARQLDDLRRRYLALQERQHMLQVHCDALCAAITRMPVQAPAAAKETP